MNDNPPEGTEGDRMSDRNSTAGEAPVVANNVGIGVPSVAALPEAFERNPNGGEMVAWLFIAWLVYRIIIALINRPRRG